jgi:hypothetical protein
MDVESPFDRGAVAHADQTSAKATDWATALVVLRAVPERNRRSAPPHRSLADSLRKEYR